MLAADRPLVTTRPLRSPHYSASVAALVGGGPGPTPGLANPSRPPPQTSQRRGAAGSSGNAKATARASAALNGVSDRVLFPSFSH